MSTENVTALAPVHQLVGQSDDEMRKEALRLAGIMADRAIVLVGGDGINGRVSGCGILGISAAADMLQRAVNAYNNHIVAWSTWK